MMKRTVGLVFADGMEYSPFEIFAMGNGGVKSIRFGNESIEFKLEKNDRQITVIGVRCGIGKVNAAAATASLISADNADIIMNAGLSGAVSGCKREDIVLGTTYVECDYDLTAIGYKLGEKPDGQKYIYSVDDTLLRLGEMSKGLKKGKLGTGDIFLTDSVKKNLYKETFDISAFDMETAAIASVCDKCGVPFMSIRKISDDADDTAEENYREMNDRQEACLTEVISNIIARMFDESSVWENNA